jgi:hypothetical protein
MSSERKVWGYKPLEDDDEMRLSFKEMFKIVLEVIDSYERDALSRQINYLHEQVKIKSEYGHALERVANEKYELIKNIILWKYREL